MKKNIQYPTWRGVAATKEAVGCEAIGSERGKAEGLFLTVGI